MGQKTKHDELISLALRKYSSRLSKEDKEDISQECKLALVRGPKDAPDKLAYRIIERTIIDWLRRTPPKMEDMADPDVVRRYNKQSVHFPDLDRQLDGEAAMWLLDKLPQPYKKVLRLLFREELTEHQAALICDRSQPWIHAIKQEGLGKLKEILENKHG